MEAAANALANCQASEAEVGTAEMTGRLKCKNGKELVTKAGKARKDKELVAKSKRSAATEADEEVARCNQKIMDFKERGQKAKAMLADLSAAQADVMKAKSDELHAKSQTGVAQGNECAEKAVAKQEEATMASARPTKTLRQLRSRQRSDAQNPQRPQKK